MRELDLLLERFLASDFEALADAEIECLEQLLDQPDQDILAWITASRKPPPRLDPIVSRVRRCLKA